MNSDMNDIDEMYPQKTNFNTLKMCTHNILLFCPIFHKIFNKIVGKKNIKKWLSYFGDLIYYIFNKNIDFHPSVCCILMDLNSLLLHCGVCPL